MAPQVFTSLCSGFGVGALKGYASPPLPGQLAGRCIVKGLSSPPLGPPPSVVRRSWDCNQLGKVGPPTVYSSSVSQHANRHLSRAGVSIAGTSGSIPRSSDIVSAASITSSLDVAEATWPHGIPGAVSSKVLHSHASPPVTAQRPLFSNGGRSSQSDPLITGLCRSSTVMARGGQEFHCKFCPRPCCCIPMCPCWAGGPSGRSDSLKSLVRGGDPEAHQHAGDAGSRTGCSCFPASVVGAECHPDERQHVGCRLSPASGQHSVSEAVSNGVRINQWTE